MDFLYPKNKYGIRVRPTQTKYDQHGMICAVDLCYEQQSYERLRKLMGNIVVEMFSTNTLEIEDYIIELTGYFLPNSLFYDQAVSLFICEFGRNKMKNGIKVADILVYRLLDAIHPFYEQINNYDDGCNEYVENYCYVLLSLIKLTLNISYLNESFAEILNTYFWTKTLPKYSMFWNDEGQLVPHYILFNVCLRERLLQIVLDCYHRIPSNHICCVQFKSIWKQHGLKNQFKQQKAQKVNTCSIKRSLSFDFSNDKKINIIKSDLNCKQVVKKWGWVEITKQC